MGAVQPAVHEREDAEDDRDRRAESGPEPREHGDRADARRQRDRGGETMLREPDARLPVEERVVERVEQRNRRRDPEDPRLPANRDQPPAAGGSAIEARSGSSGVVGTVISPRVGRSRSKVTSSSIVTSAAAASIGTSPRPRTAR